MRRFVTAIAITIAIALAACTSTVPECGPDEHPEEECGPGPGGQERCFIPGEDRPGCDDGGLPKPDRLPGGTSGDRVIKKVRAFPFRGQI